MAQTTTAKQLTASTSSLFIYTKLTYRPPELPPSLLTIIIDTNPHAWSLLAPTLPFSAAISSLLVFINAHLAVNNPNKVAVIASHSQKAEFLYPPQPSSQSAITNSTTANGSSAENGTESDSEMADPTSPIATTKNDANHYRPFHQIQQTLFSSLKDLYNTTIPSSVTPTTSIAGALTLALTYINKSQLLAGQNPSSVYHTSAIDPSSTASPSLLPRILILSVSGDLAHQYIPIMNTIFACQRLSIPIDICKIAGDTVFLQQASDATKGTYIKLEHPRGLLQYLMMGFLPDQTGRKWLIEPTAVGVDFRAACFCHRRVVDVGFVCSICLSSKSSPSIIFYHVCGSLMRDIVFCSPPEGATCLTCGTHLRLGEYGAKPAVVAKKKKKRKEKG